MNDRKSHLYHLMFLDALAVDLCEMNHNASDRCSVYEHWLEDVVSEDYAARQDSVKATYEMNKGFRSSEFEEITGETTIEVNGKIKKYALEMTDRAYEDLESKVKEKNGSY